MNRQMRNLVIMLIVLVSLVGTWLAVRFVPGLNPAATTTTTTEASLADVFALDAKAVARIEISNAGGKLTLLPVESKATDGTVTISWQLDGAGSYPISSSALESLASEVLTIAAVDEIATGAGQADLAQYGLAQPRATMTVTGKDNSRHVISLGDPLPSGNGDYVMLADTGRVCSAASTLADQAGKTLLDLLDDTRVNGGLASSDLTGFRFSRQKDQLRLVAACQSVKDEASGSSSLTFTVKEPLVRAGNDSNLLNLVNTALNTGVVRFVELDPQDLAKYGLDKPQLSFTLQSAQSTVNIDIGQAVGDGQSYARSSALPAVFIVNDSALTAVDLKLVDLVDPFVALESIWAVSAADFKAGDVAFQTTITMNKDQKIGDEAVKVTLDGRDAKIVSQSQASLYSAFYQRLIGLTYAGFEPAAQPANTRDASLVYQLEASADTGEPARTKSVEFSRRDAYTDYVFIDGVYQGGYVDHESAFNAQRSGTEGIIVAYRHLLYAMDHAVDGVFNTEQGYPPG